MVDLNCIIQMLYNQSYMNHKDMKIAQIIDWIIYK